MSPFGSILHPTDLSAGGQAAFAHALRLAVACRSRFAIVHSERLQVDDQPVWESFPAVRTTLTAWGLLPEDAPRSAVFERLGLLVSKAELGRSDPVKGLLDYFRDDQCDLIVLATQAREGLPRWLQGSVAEKLAEASGVATLFMPIGCRTFVDATTGKTDLRDIVLPIDRHPSPLEAVAMAIDVAAALDASDAVVHLLHVGRSDAMPDVKEATAQYPHVRRHNADGDVVEAITSLADRLDAGLIVMTTAGRHGILDALRGSTTQRVLRQAGRPLLAVPA